MCFKSICIPILTICRFVPEKFEEIFKKYAKIRRDALTYPEMELMLAANLDPLDPTSV
jgi:peroxygenase